MKKICIVVSDITRKGGTERAAVNLANMLAVDYKVEILSMHNVDTVIMPFYDLNSKVKLRSCRLGIQGRIMNSVNNYYSLKKYCQEFSPNIIFGFWFGISIILPFVKNRNCKVIACEHGDFTENSFVVQKLMKLMFPFLDSVVVLSELAKKKMLKLNKNIHIIPNSLPFVANDISNLTKLRVLMVGRLVELKGYDRVFPLAQFMKKMYPDWVIDIFGDGHLRGQLQNEIIRLELDNVKLHSSVKDIQKEYLNSSLFLSTSYHEALPMVFIEAMSCGLPIISYSNEGAISLLNGIGEIVNNDNELISCVDDLIKDNEKMIEMGRNGVIESKKYGIESIKSQWLIFLNSI